MYRHALTHPNECIVKLILHGNQIQQVVIVFGKLTNTVTYHWNTGAGVVACVLFVR